MKTKQLLFTLLTMLLPLVSWGDVWQDPVTKVNYEYTVGSGVANVVGGSDWNSSGSPDATGDITILSGFNIDNEKYTVTSIGNYAFSMCSNLTSVTISNTVTSIGSRAFSECSSLTSVTIPNSVTSIGEFAFYSCSGLTSITIPNSVTNVGRYAFEHCSGLTSITIPNSVISIEEGTFTYCTSLTSITIPNSVTNVGSYAFLNCRGLTTVMIPNSVTSIGGAAFYGCSGLTSITIPNSVTSMGKYVFQDCSGLTSVTIGNGVTNIGKQAFQDCSGLTSVTIGNGVTSIGESAFWGCSSLTSVTIPNSVTGIGDYAFCRCSGLSSITIGNGVTYISYSVFSGCSSLTSVTIPNSVKYIKDSVFKDCIGLISITSLIEEPFGISSGVFSSSTYENAILYVPAASINAYENTGGWKNFKNILTIGGNSTTTLIIIDENGSDLTDQVNVTWYNTDGKQIGTGNSINGIEEGTELYYSVTFGEELGRVYREVDMQKVVVESETITCQLKKIGRMQLEGRVSATDIDKTMMTVNVKQMLNGKWEQTYTAQTNEQGTFKVEVYDDVTDITVSGDGYLDATLHRDSFGGNGNVGVIPMSLVSGFAIAANITVQKAVAEGEAEEITMWTGGLNNIDFMLTNVTKGATITDFTVQNGNVIIKTGASVGDNISLTAKSKQSVFADATTEFTITEGANAFDLQLTELGGFDATCAVSNNGSTSGYLYNSNDVLVAKGSYVGETLSLRHLNSGVYTLVSMGNSSLLGSMTRLSDLTAVGLNAGTDYVSTSVEVVDGELAAVNVSEVPQLDERQFYYTNNNTYFSANKASLTVGDYLTLQAHVDFKQQYADKADGVTLTIDLPEGCEMVENSVITNRQAVPHTVNGNRVTMTLNKEQYESQVRFCIIPTLNQNYTITAMAQFDIDGQVMQPIGTVQFGVKGLSLSIPELTASTNVTVNGTAKGHSEVSIYDSDVLIGKTSSKADGSWTAQCELYKPYSHSFHEIYAKIVTENGLELTSETRQVEYDKNSLVPEKVTMLYRSSKTVFDFLQGTTSPSSYSYAPSIHDFTFLADFTRNDSTVIKNVNIKVLNSDGTVRTLPATFDGKQNCWVATTKYSSSSRLPKNVKVEYDILSVSEIYDEEIEYAMTTIINNMLAEIDNAYKDCTIEITDEYENSISFTAITNGYETRENFNITIIDYEQVKAEHIDKSYCQIINDTTDICFMVYNYDDYSSSIVIWDNLKKYALKIAIGEIASSNLTRQHRVANFALYAAYGVAVSVFEYNLRMEEIASWRKTLDAEKEKRRKQYEDVSALLYAKCPDGSYKIKDANTFNSLRGKLDQCSDGTRSYLYKFEDVINKQQLRLKQQCIIKGAAQVATAAGGAILKGASSVFKLGGSIIQALGKAIDSRAIGLMTLLSEKATSDALDYVLNNQNGQNVSPERVISGWYHQWSPQITDKYVKTANSIKASYSKCKKEKDEEDEEEEDEEQDKDNNDFRGRGSTPQIDPSGYVYEAVMSNRLEGVTATCYQKVQVEDMYGDMTEEAVVWNAEDYSQVNPQLTDKTGFYRWDVPQGMWQVKYEKEGYETVYSEWLPVPPPQLDVNISMKQSTPPTVKQMRGTESGITITMGKYMRPQTMGEGSITVTRNGMNEKGHLEMLDMEQEPKGSKTFVSKVKFVPEFRFKTSDEVYVTVGKDVESYCGVKMGQDHREKVVIESEITDIVTDSTMSVAYQGTKDVQVLVLPKEASVGRTLTAQSSSPMIASLSQEQVVIGENGLATLMLNGELPGGVVLTLSVDGTDVEKTVKVSVVIGRELVSTPVASIRNGERVELGTKLALTCDTEGATIYYTLDGSCPCNTATRQKYTEPFTLPNGVVTVKAMAETEDGEESDVVTFIYTVGEDETITGIKTLRDYVITYADGAICINGAQGATCRIYDLQGRELAYRQLLGDKATLRVPQAESYIVSVTNKNGQTVVRKVSR